MKFIKIILILILSLILALFLFAVILPISKKNITNIDKHEIHFGDDRVGFPSIEPTIHVLEERYPQTPSGVVFDYYLRTLTCLENHFWKINMNKPGDVDATRLCNEVKVEDKYLSEELITDKRAFPGFCHVQDLPDKGIKVVGESISGNEASVLMHLVYSGSGYYSFPVKLKLLGNQWKIVGVTCPSMNY